jgi:Tol biopolymer transport system component/tRNA A-37 threonylcarbamoyl transferase component Bud32
MPFDAGLRLGPYEIIAPLGAGGMGEVYRARDTRLDRIVAVKVLSGALAADSESRRRFEQEARAIAALNDPHICTIHDVGRHGELDYLVLEYLEGETLADRLRRTPALSADETLAIAIQIGDALARAHRAGIVHRDLKPGNVMLVRREGPSAAPDVKLLDFGLAARTTSTTPAALDSSLAATVGPSIVATRPPTATMASGFSGTVQYMPPEQLDGDPGDHRADIFAFGCVLYEMLAGRKAFPGGNMVTVVAAIMSSDPAPIPALQSNAPFDHVMRRCLEKDRERRWQSIADVTGELRWIAEHPLPAAVVAAPPPRSRLARAALPIAAVLLTFAAALAFIAMRGANTAAQLPALALEITTAPTDDPTMALSADGTALAFVANQNRVPMLWVRSLDRLENRVLPGTEGASFPFWSPDGRSLGFFADDKLKRIDIDGGQPLVLADAPNGRGGAWGSDGVILFAPGVQTPIMRVSIRGGSAEAVTTPGASTGSDHRWPHFLPDGKRFVYSSTLGPPETRGVYIASLDGTAPLHVLTSDSAGRFAPPDKLLTVVQGALQAYDFDPASGTVTGEPVLMAQGIVGAAGAIAVSDTGMLAYRTGTAQRRQLVWVDRKGTVVRAIGEPETGNIGSPELSPDESSVVVFSGRSGDNDVWVIELARNLARRITDGPPADAHPLWDPDGQHVVYNGARSRGPTRHAVNGGQPGPLFPDIGDRPGMALSWSRDRAWVLMRRGTEESGADLYALPTQGERREVIITQSPADDPEGQFSPDAGWVAFVSNESGRAEVFIQSFPDGRAKTQVSTTGGTQVRWSVDGREIFYIGPDGRMMAAAVSLAGPSPAVSLPTALFQTFLATGTNVIGNKAQYAVSRGGQFLLNTAVESSSAPIVVSVNWTKNRPTR